MQPFVENEKVFHFSYMIRLATMAKALAATIDKLAADAIDFGVRSESLVHFPLSSTIFSALSAAVQVVVPSLYACIVTFVPTARLRRANDALQLTVTLPMQVSSGIPKSSLVTEVLQESSEKVSTIKPLTTFCSQVQPSDVTSVPFTSFVTLAQLALSCSYAITFESWHFKITLDFASGKLGTQKPFLASAGIILNGAAFPNWKAGPSMQVNFVATSAAASMRRWCVFITLLTLHGKCWKSKKRVVKSWINKIKQSEPWGEQSLWLNKKQDCRENKDDDNSEVYYLAWIAPPRWRPGVTAELVERIPVRRIADFIVCLCCFFCCLFVLVWSRRLLVGCVFFL